MKKGAFIVIDGTDGSGKATQTELLAKRLCSEGRTVRITSFPRHGHPSGYMVEEYLKGKFGTAAEVGPYRGSIFYAVDRYAASFEIRRWLAAGHDVIIDRWVSANMGHQASKLGTPAARRKMVDWISNLEYGTFNLPKPDIILLLYMPPPVSRKLVISRGNKRDIHERDRRHIEQAAKAYLEVARRYRWPIIDCAPGGKLRTIAEVHELVWAKVKPKFR